MLDAIIEKQLSITRKMFPIILLAAGLAAVGSIVGSSSEPAAVTPAEELILSQTTAEVITMTTDLLFPLAFVMIIATLLMPLAMRI